MYPEQYKYLEFLHIGLRSTVVGAPHSQNLFEHQPLDLLSDIL